MAIVISANTVKQETVKYTDVRNCKCAKEIVYV